MSVDDPQGETAETDEDRDLADRLRRLGVHPTSVPPLLEHVDTWDELASQPVGALLDVDGIGPRTVQALVPDDVDVEREDITVAEARGEPVDDEDVETCDRCGVETDVDEIIERRGPALCRPCHAALNLADEGLLTEQQATAWTLRTLAGHKRREAAERMDISISVHDAHMRTARDKIEAAKGTADLVRRIEDAQEQKQ